MKSSCCKCGSLDVIPNAEIMGYGTAKVKAVVSGKPDAFMFKDPLRVDIDVQICGECGHMELKASNPKALFRRYKSSLQDRDSI